MNVGANIKIILIIIITIIPCNTHLLEKITIAQPLKEPSAFYGVRMFIKVFKNSEVPGPA
jgi:hypothetical protein